MVNIGDVWQFALRQTLYNQEVINTFALKVTAVPGSTSEATFMDALWSDATGVFNLVDGLRDEIRQSQSQDVTHWSWIVHRVDPNPTNVFTIPLSTNLNGDIASPAETANIAMSIMRKGLDAGRRNRGRIAIAGIPPTRYNAGSFTGEALADAAGIAAQMRGTGNNGAGISWSIGWWNPAHTGIVDGVPVNYPAKYTAAVAASAMSTVRVQRSRTVGVGT